ncbi:unnamed protein product, partial [Prorocentrum cordatum]
GGERRGRGVVREALREPARRGRVRGRGRPRRLPGRGHGPVDEGPEGGGGGGGLMQALAQALMADVSEFKLAVFDTIAAAARWPTLRGRVAGSGVLGVLTAMLLAPRHPPPVKALMARLCGLLGVDAPEAASQGGPRRAEEFAKLRKQLVHSNALAALVAQARPGADPEAAAAAAGALAALGGSESDEATRRALGGAGAVRALLARLPEDQAASDPGEGPADAASSDDEQDFGRRGRPGAGFRPRRRWRSWPRSRGRARGRREMLAALWEPSAVARLWRLAGDVDSGGASGARRGTGAVEHALRCLALVGARAGVWPELNEEFTASLVRLLVFGSE